MKVLGAGLAVGLTALSVWSVAAIAEPSGAVVAVIQQSEADGETGKRVLQVEGPVFSGDKIITGARGEAQIKFRDETKLVVGPNSSMTIDAFVFAANGNAKQFSINAVRGAFRFITGKSSKSAYAINTPVATIGVRGTEFDFIFQPRTQELEVVTFGGTTTTCPTEVDPATGQKPPCIISRDPCGLSLVAPNDDRYVKPSTERDIRVNRSFLYVLNQSRLQPEFQVDIKSCGNVQNVPTFENHGGGSSFVPPVEPPDDDGGGNF